MNNKSYDNSKSDFQAKIEKVQIKKLEENLNITGLANDSNICFKGDPNSKIKPDIYSAEHLIIGEVYTHLGKLKSAQMHKVMADILKLILFKEDSGAEYKMYYLICDEDVRKSMLGNAVICNAVRLHRIEIVCFELDDALKATLKETMRKQDLTSR